MNLFFYGTLRDRDVLQAVLGRHFEGEMRKALLRGYRPVTARGQTYPVLAEDAADAAEGALAGPLTEGDVARLVAYEGPDYDLVEKPVETADGTTVRAALFVPRAHVAHDPGRWSFEEWLSRHKALWLRRIGGRLAQSQLAPRLSAADVELIRRDTAFQGYFRIDRYELRHRLFRGGWSAKIRRELFERGHAVAVLPYDPARDEVVLIRQFRVGPYAAGDEPWQIEVVAGIIDEGETPEEVGRREMQEEAGLTPLTPLRHMLKCFASPGGTSETFELFAAKVDSSTAGGIHGLPEEGEDIQVLVWSFAQAMAALDEGLIANSPAVIALQWLAIHRERLRTEWQHANDS
jgi:ADP-ribose pyrophosphatase